MKPFSFLPGALLLIASSLASAADGLVALKSPLSAAATLDRLESLVKQRGLTVFARIDHAAGAAGLAEAAVKP